MRLITSVSVVVLLIAGAAAFADVAPDTATTNMWQGPSMSQPSGAGPSDTTMPLDSTTTSTTTTVTTTITPPAMSMSSEADMFNTNHVVSTFGVDRGSVTQLRSAGWGWGDIYLMANIAQKSRKPILDIAGLRSQNMSWTDIASHYSLTAMDITNSPAVVTRVAGYTTEYGYQPIYYKTDPWGNPVLTRYDAERYGRMGYGWQDIAVAANISARTGARIPDVLAWTDRGYTWDQVAREYGLHPKRMMDISQYPFSRSGMSTRGHTMTTPAGAGPSMMPDMDKNSNMPTY